MPIKNISPNALYDWMQQDQVMLIDVRTPKEHAAQCIYLSHSLPLSCFSLDALPHIDARYLVIHCQKGVRSLKACQALLALKADMTVYNLEGGIAAWHDCGLPTVSSDPENTQAAAHAHTIQRFLGVCMGVLGIVAYFIHPVFILLLAVLGVAMSFTDVLGPDRITRWAAMLGFQGAERKRD